MEFDKEKFIERLDNMKTPYTETPCAFCYPGTPLLPDIVEVAKIAMSKQINMIGTHTLNTFSDKDESIGESGFEMSQYMEREYIWWIGKMFCKNDKDHVKDIIDGYFCGGGTEANIEGMWIGREYLRKLNKDAPIYVLFTKLTHYSISKAMHILDIENYVEINYNNNFEMDVKDLKIKLSELQQNGVKNILIVANVGTTTCGSIDPITDINATINEFKQTQGNEENNFYFHIDASFGGYTVPFVQDHLHIGFENDNVCSIAIDADKMGRLPYPSGVFLCRKHLQLNVSRRVQYIKGHTDDTISGSRTAMSSIAGYYYMKTRDYIGHRDYVMSCINNRDKLSEMLKKIQFIQVLPYSPFINMLPIIINIPDNIINTVLNNYHLRSDVVIVGKVKRTVYKLCIMEHTFNHIEKFVSDLVSAYDNR